MKNIGIDARMLGNKHGGIGRYVLALSESLLEIDKENNYFLFYNSSASEEDLVIYKKFSNCQLVKVSARHYSFNEQTLFLMSLNSKKLDLVHFPNFNVPLLYNRPFVVTIHDLVHHKISGAKKSRFLHFQMYKKIIANAARKAKQIITVSEYSKKDIASFLKIPLEKIRVIYEGTSLSPNISQSQIEKVKESFLLHRPYFLFVGVLERKKNLVNLAKGFGEFLTKFNLNMDLVIVGKSDLHYPEIKEQTLEAGPKGHIVFTGYVDDITLSALYSGALAYVSASEHEGFGLPGVEAMGFGLPLVVSNISVFNEIYDQAAIYFDPQDLEDIANKLGLIAGDESFRKRLTEKSLARASLFDWKKCAEQTLKVYKNVL